MAKGGGVVIPQRRGHFKPGFAFCVAEDILAQDGSVDDPQV